MNDQALRNGVIHTLVCTLGGQPQLPTLTLDALVQEKRQVIQEVIVLHPSGGEDPERMERALAILREEFRGGFYHHLHLPCKFTSVPLMYRGEPIADIDDDDSADAALDCIQDLLQELKRENRHLHISISGGLRFMAFFIALIGPLYLDHRDRFWHLRTPRTVQEHINEGQRMHALPGEGVHLIRGPLIPLGRYTSVLAHKGMHARDMITALMEEEDHLRCQVVFAKATEAQQRVLVLYAQGLNQEQVAQRLVLSPHTVSSHTRELLARAKEAWGTDERLTYAFLQRVFRTFEFPPKLLHRTRTTSDPV